MHPSNNIRKNLQVNFTHDVLGQAIMERNHLATKHPSWKIQDGPFPTASSARTQMNCPPCSTTGMMQDCHTAMWNIFPLAGIAMSSQLVRSSSWADTACTGNHFRAAYSGYHWLCLWLSTSWTTFLRCLAGSRCLLEENISECRIAACSSLLFH